ncbi:SGNH/GDSL hydrolase family protein [Limnohabitans sp.]|uniref:SGNH/GDSL hydrolase family protein n=1 Tax=Limnohabitans sp. TaxID=1907725 RepID=UPI00286EDC6B|nr:SGNH/GDSL hydrolase family protein [Limnohabitans sp.]
MPKRVVGLGDGYNDIRTALASVGGLAPTVRTGAHTTSSVVEQVAALFGTSNVVSAASGGAKVADLSAQITSVGAFSETDLVVITIGTFNVKERDDLVNAPAELVRQIRRLQGLGVAHILVMPVLEVSKTPWGLANPSISGATDAFNSAILGTISPAFGGRSPNPVIYANASNLAPVFLTETAGLSVVFSNHVTPACTAAAANVTLIGGCDVNDANTSYTTMLFADGIHLTPAGNRWVANYLYAATGSGWR